MNMQNVSSFFSCLCFVLQCRIWFFCILQQLQKIKIHDTHTNTHIHTHRQPVEKKCKNRETMMAKHFLKPSINKWHTQNDSNRFQLLILNVTHGLCSIIRWKRTKKIKTTTMLLTCLASTNSNPFHLMLDSSYMFAACM